MEKNDKILARRKKRLETAALILLNLGLCVFVLIGLMIIAMVLLTSTGGEGKADFCGSLFLLALSLSFFDLLALVAALVFRYFYVTS